MVVWTSLQTWENRLVDFFFNVIHNFIAILGNFSHTLERSGTQILLYVQYIYRYIHLSEILSIHMSRSSIRTSRCSPTTSTGSSSILPRARLTTPTQSHPLGLPRGSRVAIIQFPTKNRSGPHQMSPIVTSHPPLCNFPPYQGYKMPQHPGSLSVFGLTPIQIDHPEDQDHSLRLYGLPSSLRESTFVAKNLRIRFLLTAVVGPYPDSVTSEFYYCAEHPLNQVGHKLTNCRER